MKCMQEEKLDSSPREVNRSDAATNKNAKLTMNTVVTEANDDLMLPPYMACSSQFPFL